MRCFILFSVVALAAANLSKEEQVNIMALWCSRIADANLVVKKKINCVPKSSLPWLAS